MVGASKAPLCKGSWQASKTNPAQRFGLEEEAQRSDKAFAFTRKRLSAACADETEGLSSSRTVVIRADDIPPYDRNVDLIF